LRPGILANVGGDHTRFADARGLNHDVRAALDVGGVLHQFLAAVGDVVEVDETCTLSGAQAYLRLVLLSGGEVAMPTPTS
jgi:hypothetical protein